jgi:hypothetical protein
LQQARQDTADAAYYRSAAKDALFAGYVGAAAGAAGGISKGFSKGGGGSPTGGMGLSLTTTGGLY